jgi:hypothetical protein
MLSRPELLLVGAVAGVGVLHTLVPDHWAPIALIARQRHWTRSETARAAALAGTGHAASTLIIGLLVWIAGVAVATKFGHVVSLASSLALIAFGVWIAWGAWQETRHGADQHVHHHADEHDRSKRTALLLILGSSPMIEGLPAFFAAGRYGPVLLALMAVVFALTTITTYVVLCVSSVASLERVSFGPLERYGEILSGAFIALVGLIFLIFPLL